MFNINKKTSRSFGINLQFIHYQHEVSYSDLDHQKVEAALEALTKTFRNNHQHDSVFKNRRAIRDLLFNLSFISDLPDKLRANVDKCSESLDKICAQSHAGIRQNRQQKFLSDLAERLEAFQGMFGTVLEIALHDLARPSGKTLCRIFGSVTGRSEGAPMTPTGDAMLQARVPKRESYSSNYRGKKVKSTSVLLKDEEEAYGMLCFNIDLDMLEKDSNKVLQELLYTAQKGDEIFPKSERERADQTLEMHASRDMIEKYGGNFLDYLHEKAPFLFRNEIIGYVATKLASKMGCPADILESMIRSRYEDIDAE